MLTKVEITRSKASKEKKTLGTILKERLPNKTVHVSIDRPNRVAFTIKPPLTGAEKAQFIASLPKRFKELYDISTSECEED